MVSQESGVSGGYGATPTRGGGGRVIEPVVPPTYGTSQEGTYTDPQGRPITKKQAQSMGIVDKPGEGIAKIAAAGAGVAQAPTQKPIGLEALKAAELQVAKQETARRQSEIVTTPGVAQAPTQKPIGLEALKAAELQVAKQETARRQSEIVTTPGEAAAIQRMLKSPTAQFASQEASQRGYELASRYDRGFAPEQVRATLVPQYVTTTQQAPSRFFYPAPVSQAGIRPKFPTPAQIGSLAEMEGYRSRLSLYRPAMRSIALSESLQRGFERRIGYSEQASAPVKFVAGAGSVVTSFPGFVGTGLLGYEALAKMPRKTLTQTPKSAIRIGAQFVEQAKINPYETAGQLTGMYLGGKAISKAPALQPGLRALARSETATLRPADVWSKIPTMRETAAKAGRELTRKIEYGRTFKEPSGAGMTSMSGRQALISIQQTKLAPQQFRHTGQRYERGLKTVDVTSQEFRQSARVHAPAKSIAEQKAILSKYFGEQKQVSVQATQQKLKILPSYLQLQTRVSKQVQAPQMIQKQISSQISRQKPIVVQRTKQVYANLPMSIQAQTHAMKSIQVQRTFQIQRPAQVQRMEPVRVQRMPEPRFQKIKQIELPKTPSTISPLFKKKRKGRISTRRFTTALGGKTVKQLQASLRKRIL